MQDNKAFLRASASSYLSKLWSLLSNFLFVPVYITLLGLEQYGVIIIAASINLIVAIADAGITPGIVKYMSQMRGNNKSDLNSLVQSFESTLVRQLKKVSWLFLVLLCLLSLYLHNSADVEDAWLLSLLIIASNLIHLFTTFYRAAFVGKEMHEVANYSHMLYGVARNGVVCVPIYFYPNLELFFIWQCGAALLYVIYARAKLGILFLPKIGLSQVPAEAINLSKKLLFVSILGVYLNNLDKFLLGAFSSLEKVGIYGGMFLLSQASFIMLMPVISTIYPSVNRFLNQERTSLINNKRAVTVYKGSVYLNTLITLILIVFFEKVFVFWTGRNLESTEIAAGQILVFGGYFSAAHLFFYHVALTRSYLIISKYVLLFCSIFTTVYFLGFANFSNLIQVALPWLFTNLLLFIGYYLWMRRIDLAFFEECSSSHMLSLTAIVLIGVYIAYSV